MKLWLGIFNVQNNEFRVNYTFQYLDDNMLVDLRDKNLEIVIRDSETNEEILRLNNIFNNITESIDERRIYSTENAEAFKFIKSKHELLTSLEGKNVTIEVQLFDGKTYIRDLIIDRESIIEVDENGYVTVYTKNFPIYE